MSLPPHALSYIAAAAQCQDSRAQYIWLDVDPGHDDALAILAAVHLPQIAVLGVSAVHGNASLPNTTLNAARCLEAFGAPPEIAVYAGCSRPLLRPRVDAADIHGSDGLGGVEGLRTLSDAAVLGRVNRSGGLHPSTAIALACEVAQKRGKKLTLVAAGPLTNVALFVSLYPLLVRDALAEIVIMGGAVGVGNKTPVAEYNIVCDPDAAQIVLDAEVIVRMIPLQCTHQAILDGPTHALIRNPDAKDTVAALTTPAVSPLRTMISSLVTFFAETYRDAFGFSHGPPMHDVLTVMYVALPELFTGKRYRVDVERSSPLTLGQTVVDVYGAKSASLAAMAEPESAQSWGPAGKNVWVGESVQTVKLWQHLLECIKQCDRVSPLNIASSSAESTPKANATDALESPTPSLPDEPDPTPSALADSIKDIFVKTPSNGIGGGDS